MDLIVSHSPSGHLVSNGGLGTDSLQNQDGRKVNGAMLVLNFMSLLGGHTETSIVVFSV